MPGPAVVQEPRHLDDGLVLRPASDADVEGIVELSLRQHGPQEEWGLRHLLTDPADWTVVVDGNRVVSTCTLLHHELEYDGGGGTTVTLPVGHVEYVATDEAYQRRGLVRAQFEAHHRRSEQRGDVLQLVFGIPYFYRRFGYAYGLSYPDRYLVRDDQLAAPTGHDVEPATAADVPDIAALHAARVATADLRLPWPVSAWRALVEGRAVEGVVLAVRRAGELRGFLRLQAYPDDGVAEVIQAATADLESARALLVAARAGADGLELGVLDQPADPLGTLLRSVGHVPAGDFGGVYVRVPDPRRLVEVVRPALSARLQASPLAGDRGSLVISLYRESLVLHYADGAITAVEGAAGVEDPPVTGDVGVPPDAFAALVLGRFGASRLAERVDDVVLGRHAGLADVLFPAMRPDVIDIV